MTARRAKLVEKFRDVAGRRVERIREALAAEDEPTRVVERELHTLKGEAQLLGFKPLGQVALAIENIIAASGVREPRVAAGLDLLDRLRDRPPAGDEEAALAQEFCDAHA